MPLETASYINQLDAANPLGSDPIAAGDDHIRLIKAAVKATFPNITGPVTKTQAEINNLASQADLTALQSTITSTVTPFLVPVGSILMWSGAIAAIPAGWALCDGTNGTPNLRDRFVVGAGTSYAVGATGGSKDAVVVSHTHSATSVSTVTDPGHTHTVSTTNQAINNVSPRLIGADKVGLDSVTIPSATTGITVATVTTNSTEGVSGTNANLPPYYALAYIMKL